MPALLLVEDDIAIREYYSESLEKAGFNVHAFDNKNDALLFFKTNQADLVILDIVLGKDKEAGLKLCVEIRAISPDVPIIFVTSLDSETDKISGMGLDANDYITKDVSIEYLIIRIKALLHRTKILLDKNTTTTQNEISLGDLYINMDTLVTKWKNKTVNLNLTQLWMLHALVNSQNSMLTPRQLMDAANIVVQLSSVTVQVRNIRKRFKELDKDFSALKSERGVGYRWVVND